jgi:hypothetical protein
MREGRIQIDCPAKIARSSHPFKPPVQATRSSQWDALGRMDQDDDPGRDRFAMADRPDPLAGLRF